MSERKDSHLLLTIKSLTQNRRQKNYIISIENHNIQNKLNIQSVFPHNYEYVYKLWPCQTSDRQLIKITMFQRIGGAREPTIVKRGEATPLVKYSHEGERFQFYGSFNQKCVLVLKFRVSTKQNIQDEVNEEELERMNRSLRDHLKVNKDQSQSYKNYLEYTNNLLESLNKYPIVQKKDITLDSKYRRKNQSSVIDVKKNANLNTRSQAAQSTFGRSAQVGSLYSPKKVDNQLTKDRYLNSTLNLDQENSPYQLLATGSIQKEPSKLNRKSFIYEQSRIEEQVNKRIDMSSEIKKKREKYIGQKVQPIIKKPSQSPLMYFVETPSHQNGFQKQAQRNKAQPSNIIQFSQSFVNKQYCQPNKMSELREQPKLMKQNAIKTNIQVIQSDLSASNDQKNEMNSHFSVIRAQKFPIRTQKVVQGKQFGSIRRKKIVSNTKSGKKFNNEQEVCNNNKESQQFQPNITHYSIHSKINESEESATYNITLFNFKAVLYAGNKTFPKKLVIIFQDSRYSTSVNNCVSLTTQWHQRFGIKNCKENSYIYFKLISVGHKQREEGQSQVIANDIINCLTNVYRCYFFVDDLAVGYLQFQFQKAEISLDQEGWKREPERNTISLPQLKNSFRPPKNQKRRSSLNVQKYSKQQQRGTTKTSKNIHNPDRKSVALGANYAANRQAKGLLVQKQKLMSKIRQKKMQLKAKLK